MTRLIDADALNEKLCKTTIFIKDGEVFQRMINDAPTIEQPTGDLISRQDAINAIENTDVKITAGEWDELTNAIKSLPSAGPRPGEWIFEETDEYKRTYCSVCGASAPFECVSDDYYGRKSHGETRKTDFCPHCGADMRGEEE